MHGDRTDAAWAARGEIHDGNQPVNMLTLSSLLDYKIQRELVLHH